MTSEGAKQSASAFNLPFVTRSICNWRKAGGYSFHSEMLGGLMPSAWASLAFEVKNLRASEVVTMPILGAPTLISNRRHLSLFASGGNTQFMGTIGSRIKALRIQAGLSGAELARLLGIAGPSLWEIENGETKSLKAGTLLGILEHLHTTADYILTGGDERSGPQLPVMEAELIYSLRSLPADKRLALVEYARFLLEQSAVRPAPAAAPTAAATPRAVVTRLKPRRGK